MKAKKILAVVLSAAMVLGCGLTSLAGSGDSQTIQGSGSFNGINEQSVVKVILPTYHQSLSQTFDYIADPQNLIGLTVSSGGTTGWSEDGREIEPNDNRVYFSVTSGSSTYYDSTSTKLKMTNKGSKLVNITVSAKSNDAETNMELVDKTTAEAGLTTPTANPSIYLGLVGEYMTDDNGTMAAMSVQGGGTSEVPDDGTEVKLTASLSGQPDNFNLRFDEENRRGYTYAVKDNLEKDWYYCEFALEGICPDSNNLTAESTAPNISVTYSWVDPSAPTPGISFAANKVTASNLNLTGVSFVSITASKDGGAAVACDTDPGVVVTNTIATNGKLVVDLSGEGWQTYMSGSTMTFTLNYTEDGTPKTKTVSHTFP